MSTPASPAPAASPAPGGGMPAAAPAAPGSTPQPRQPENLVAQAQERSAAAEHTDDDGLTPDEERQLGDLLAKRDKAAAADTVRLRVEGVHESVQVGHVVVGRDWTEVPVSMVAALTEGAAEAGVQVTQDESES